jgi:bifunctional non-homologous end joining protein LigD
MLATLVSKPFDRPGWVYEEKYDGYRILAYKEGSRVTLLSRNNKDRTELFRHVADAVQGLPSRTLLLDGEVVAFDSKHVSRFQLLQDHADKAKYAVFDCLYKDGRDLRKVPLQERRNELESVVPKTGVIFLSRQLADNGIAAFQAAKKNGFEGVVAKDLSAPYIERRSTKWLKIKVHQEEELVIAGYTAPEGTRPYFGALLLGAYDNGHLVYVGKVGTGFSQSILHTLYQAFQPLVQKSSPFAEPPAERTVTYLKPRLVAQIVFQEWTADRKLRQPVFLGLRDDKSARECLLPKVFPI